MALLDANLMFSDLQAITADAASTYVIDLADMAQKTTTFTPAADGNHGSSTYFGEDLGLGAGIGTPRIFGQVGTTFLTNTSLTTDFQAAPDNATAHASGNISDLTFANCITTQAVVLALLTAGARIFSFAWPKRALYAMSATIGKLPRFVRLNYTVNGSDATAGTLSAGVQLGGDDAQDTVIQYPNNFAVGA